MLLLWLGWEALVFYFRTRILVPRLIVARAVQDDRGPIHSLWAGRSFTVRAELQVPGWLELPYVVIEDLVPFSLVLVEGLARAEGPVWRSRPLTLTYRIHCEAAGLARFEGLRLQIADPAGLFYFQTFVRSPFEMRIMPALSDADSKASTRKRLNLLPPPGLHILRRPGSGSELLDLRDYIPGDPPKTIAWKVSARRDRLITKEFESEVPVRCTLFVDTSDSVRVPGRRGSALARLVEIAGGVIQSNASARDLTALILFDDRGSTAGKAERTAVRLTEMLRQLAEAAALAPAAADQIDPERLMPLAYGFAQEVYPDLLAPSVNTMPWYQNWVAAFPQAWRQRVDVFRHLFRRKEKILLLGALVIPFSLLFFNLYVLIDRRIEIGTLKSILKTSFICSLIAYWGAMFIFVGTTMVTAHERRISRWRKRLAALFVAQYDLGPGALAFLLEDDDQFSLFMQRFLADHQVPYSLPLYNRGKYRFRLPDKVPVLVDSLLKAVTRGHDNELFVLMADLLELEEDDLMALLRAVRVALARHHHVVLICPWPPGLPLPDRVPKKGRRVRSKDPANVSLRRATTVRLHAAFARLRRWFGRLGVPVLCAAEGDPIRLILDRMDRLRGLGRRR